MNLKPGESTTSPEHRAMMGAALAGATVLVIGAGAMGAGIAQVAAQAGHEVWLYDQRDGAAESARAGIDKRLQALVQKGRISREAAADARAHLKVIHALEEASGKLMLAIEAIVEDLGAKRSLFGRIEMLLDPRSILATNTSSISVTAIASTLQRPGRLIGMHFFNPVPTMKLVEVVSGLRTDESVSQAVSSLARSWGKVPVHARSTPGFIVNRIARPFYGEAWALLQECAASPRVIDECMRGAGFRMGPFELMDTIGLDVNLAVTRSVYNGFFGDKRYQPSPLQVEMVAGGLLGRKSGRGFYEYGPEISVPAQPEPYPPPAPSVEVVVNGQDGLSEEWAAKLVRAGYVPLRRSDPDWTGLSIDGAQLRLTEGRTASRLTVDCGKPDIAVFDLPLRSSNVAASLSYAVASVGSEVWQEQVPRWLNALGYQPVRVEDTPGLVVARIIAMLVNEAVEAVHQQVCSIDAVESAMTLGVNYPAGPFAWLERRGPGWVTAMLDHLADHYRSDRYRASPGLRQRAWNWAFSEQEAARATRSEIRLP